MKVKDKFLTAYRSDRVLLGEWILTVVAAAFVFLFIAFVDMISLTVWSTNVWDVIFGSGIRQLYAYTAQNIYGIQHAYMGSELFSVLPWSVWNLPIWLVQRLTGTAIAQSPAMLAWSKLFLVVLTLVLLHYTKKITLLLTGDRLKASWAVFLSAGSAFLCLGVFYAGQNDIIMITPSVIGVYYLLRGKQLPFLIWSAAAIAVKPFFLLPFLALVLLYEKRIIWAALKLLVGVIGIIAQKLLFMGAPMYTESISEGPAKEMIEEMFPENLSTSFGGVSFLAVSLVLIYLYAYTRRFSMQEMQAQNVLFGKYAVYLVAVTNMAYLMFSPFSFYRLAILVPFLYIVTVQNDKLPFYHIIVETAMSLCLVIKVGIRGSSSLFRSKALNLAPVHPLFGFKVSPGNEGAYESLETFLIEKDSILLYFQPLFSGVALVCGVLLLAWGHPEKQMKQPLFLSEKNCRWLLWARAAMMVPFVLIVLYLYLKAPVRV